MALDKNEKILPKGITLRSDGRFMGRFTYAGERYTLYDDDNPKRLKKALEDMRYELEHGIKGKVNNVTLDKWVEIWLTEYKANTVKESTYMLYRNYYEWYIKPQIGRLKIKDIKNVHIQKIFNAMKDKKLSLNTMKKTYSIIYDILNYALNNDIILKNPCIGIALPKQEIKKRRVMTTAEQEIFEKSMQGSTYEHIYKVALCSGMRIGEILGLTWADVDFENGLISVNRTLLYYQSGKGGKCVPKFQEPKTKAGKRSIPMLSQIIRALKLQKLQQNTQRVELGNNYQEMEGFENLIFTTKFGKPIYESYVNENLKYIVSHINKEEYKQAKEEERDPVVFEKITPHTLRHTFATRAFEKGMKPKTVQEILGHSSLSMTMDLYTHVTEETKIEEMKKLERQA
nr:MAG TPA: Integrase [Caudoviricetes sp.]